MATPSSSSGRNLLLRVLAGCIALPFICATLVGCLALAGLASAGYWAYGQRAGYAERRPATPNVGTGSAANSLQSEFESLPVGDAGAGEQVFTGEGGCQACHALNPDVRGVGPSLAGVAARAAEYQANYSAELYLYEAIVDPNAHIVDGFQNNLMPANFKQRLSEQQIANLIAFLMTK